MAALPAPLPPLKLPARFRTVDESIADDWAETCEAWRHAQGHSGMRSQVLGHADALLDLWLDLHPIPAGAPA